MTAENPNQGLLGPEQLDEILSNTLGAPTSLLDTLRIYRQGKEDYFECKDVKYPTVRGIFLMSMRPTRAWWESQELSSAPPVCFSLDSIKPHRRSAKLQSETCAACPHDQFGTAKQGRGKACKTRASDFMLEVRKDTEIFEGRAQVNPREILGPGLIQYSIGNRDTSDAYQAFVRVCQEQKVRPQGVLVEWGWSAASSKSGVKYHACAMKVLATLLPPDKDPELWNAIVGGVKNLKAGNADAILSMMAGGPSSNDEA